MAGVDQRGRPGNRRIAVLVDSTTGPGSWQRSRRRPRSSESSFKSSRCEAPGELDNALEAAAKGGSRALVQLSSPLFDRPAAKLIAEFTAKHRLPAISMFRSFAEAGGLMAYGPNEAEYRQAPGRLHRQDPQGREARRSPHRASRQSSTSSSTSRPPRRSASRSRRRCWRGRTR